MLEEPQDIPPRVEPEEASGKAVAAMIFGVLGLAHLCPCIGPVVAIALGWGETSGVGKAAVILGWVGLGIDCLIVLATLGTLVPLIFMS